MKPTQNNMEKPKDSEIILCGYTLKDIKKAFYGGKLNKLLADMQADGTLETVDDAKALKVYLGELKRRGQVVIDEMKDGYASELGLDEIQPPSVDALVGEDSNLDQWIKDRDEVMIEIKSKMKVMRTKLSGKENFDIKELQDLAFELAFWRNWIVQDAVYKRQLWKRKLTSLIDDFKISRKEAEDRSELTPEYRDYVLAIEFQKTIEDLIVSARKGYTE